MKARFSTSVRFLLTFSFALWVSVAAQAAAPVITNIVMIGGNAQLTIHSNVGSTNQIQCCSNLSQGWWLALTNVVVAQSPYWFVDMDTPPSSQRFYRARVVGPTPDGMALAPAGSFTMGNCMDPGEGYSDEMPLHTVYVSAFYIDTNLVTYSLWTNVCQWATNHGYSFDNAGLGKAADDPVVEVEWFDVVKWCNARSEMEGLTPCYYTNASLSRMTTYRSGAFQLATNWVNWVANGYRLPTEAEWEKAARGGVSGHRFPWSDADTIDWSRANYFADPIHYSYDVNPSMGYNPAGTNGGNPYTSPVGSFAPNGYGLYDMAGNALEWCWDWYDSAYYSLSPGTDPRGPAFSPNVARVWRGGTWNGSASAARCSRRGSNLPMVLNGTLGFRCVRGF